MENYDYSNDNDKENFVPGLEVKPLYPGVAMPRVLYFITVYIKKKDENLHSNNLILFRMGRKGFKVSHA